MEFFAILWLLVGIYYVYSQKRKTKKRREEIVYTQESIKIALPKNNSPYLKWKTKDYFFSKAELFFYRELLNFCDEKWLCVFPKVRIADLTTPRVHLDNSSFMKVFLKLSQKHVDYVITDTKGKILCVLELDWKSHSYWKTLENDRFKNKFFDDIELPLLRFSNYWNHSFSKIEELTSI